VLAGEPRSENEIASCQRLGERLAQWVAVFLNGNREAHPLQTRTS